MSLIKHKVWLSAALLGAAAVLLPSCDDDEEESSYKTFSEMERSGPIAAWVPVWVPRNASDIHERHDLGSNSFILVFKCDAKSIVSALPPELKPAAPGKMAEPAGLDAKWFPDGILSKGYKYYFSEEGSMGNGKSYLAIADAEGLVFFWRQ